jgi:DNA-binding YbaB/EbfC family protein
MLKDMGALFKQAKEMQTKMTEIQESLAQQKVEASVGGGMVQVTANGNNEILSVKVEEELINMNDKAILEDLLVGAINEAMRKANELKQTEMAKLTGGMKIPGLF